MITLRTSNDEDAEKDDNVADMLFGLGRGMNVTIPLQSSVRQATVTKNPCICKRTCACAWQKKQIKLHLF